MKYLGIELTPPKGTVAFSHSVFLDMIKGQSSAQNTDWFDVLGNFPWGSLKDQYFQGYDNVCRLYSLVHLDYQVCNGGIEQYFLNGYHEHSSPHHEDDVSLYGIDEQKKDFIRLVSFAKELYPSRTAENEALSRACDAFQAIWIEENAEFYETIECEKDEYIIDPETGDEIENPDYFEPYEETYTEDVIHGAEGFNELFFAASSYLEELLELRAQFYCKTFARDLEKHAPMHPALTQKMREILPASAYEASPDLGSKPSLSALMQDADSRTRSSDAVQVPNIEDITHDRS